MIIRFLIGVFFTVSLVFMVKQAIAWAEAGAAYDPIRPSTWMDWDDQMVYFFMSFGLFLTSSILVCWVVQS